MTKHHDLAIVAAVVSFICGFFFNDVWSNFTTYDWWLTGLFGLFALGTFLVVRRAWQEEC